jgi:RNA polymerase sigma-70 factor (ECF subfamily)
MIKALGTDSAEGLAQLTDEELLSRYRDSGRAEDFDALVHRYENELFRYLVRYPGDRALAEDVFQSSRTRFFRFT